MRTGIKGTMRTGIKGTTQTDMEDTMQADMEGTMPIDRATTMRTDKEDTMLFQHITTKAEVCSFCILLLIFFSFCFVAVQRLQEHALNDNRIDNTASNRKS